MVSLTVLELIMSDKDYHKIATNLFQGYANEDFEEKLLWESIKIDFETWTKDYSNATNSKTWSVVIRFCIFYDVLIEDYKNNGSRSEILMKLVSATNYDIEPKNWHMDQIGAIKKIHNKVSRGITLQIQVLQSYKPD